MNRVEEITIRNLLDAYELEELFEMLEIEPEELLLDLYYRGRIDLPFNEEEYFYGEPEGS